MDENVTKCGMGEQYNLHFVFHLVDAFLLRDAIHSADHAVCLSVCPSNAGILFKRLNNYPQTFYRQVVTAF